MSFRDQVVTDAESVIFSAADWTEAAEFEQTGLTAKVSLTRTLWSILTVAELGGGWIADAMEIYVLASELVDAGDAVTPKRGARLYRFPGVIPAEETWRVEGPPQLEGGVWRLECERDIRAVPR